MITLTGYQILAQIYASLNSEVYRATRLADGRAVILKVLKDYPTARELARYKQEYKTINSLNFDSAIARRAAAEPIAAYSLETFQRTVAIVLEDFGAISLRKLLEKQPLTVKEFLPIGIEIVASLKQIHAAKIIHKDINPANIVINPTTRQVKIIDFGLATILKQENPVLKAPQVIEGTLAYISPEQTGRMNRSLDYRTDYYSLGVTFYELLTQQLPFQANDALELVHCHLAKQPLSPHELNPNIPPAVSNIVMKLMAKTAEERYQSADGIKFDLEACWNQLSTTGKIVDLAIASRDLVDRFQIPQKLYGREREIASLLAAFEKVASGANSSPQLTLVTGHSGLGKTTLVREIYKPITQKRGYFIAGKFEQFQRNVPYSAVVSALKDLVRQLLSESNTSLKRWRKKLLAALGSNGRVIVDVIPEVELIIGRQPELPQLGATAAQNRFNLVFKSFIRVFCASKHPLVLFLDDLQWADTASLKLIELITLDTDFKYLFTIGSYRDNEIDPTHSLQFTLQELHREGIVIERISLQPLSGHQIAQLISDTLNCKPRSVRSLAKLVWQKTHGNPFFINEFLKSIYSENLLLFEPVEISVSNARSYSGGWQWNLKQIERIGCTDNLVKFMIDKMQKLPQSALEVLSVAACIGTEFDINILSIICQQSAAEIFEYLVLAIDAGLIIPQSDLNEQLLIQDYKFAHDRIQQAIYTPIEVEKKLAIHLKIGRLLWRQTQPQDLLEKIFKIVDRLNLGWRLVKEGSELKEIARLNLLAGRKAKAANAYEAALKYLKIGRELANDWQTNYDLLLALHSEAAEVAFLNGDFEEMEHYVSVVLQQAKTLLDKVKVYEVQIEAYQSQNQDLEAIQMALPMLDELGFILPSSRQKEIQRELKRVRASLADLQIEDLIELPQISDPEKLAAIEIASSIFSSIFVADSQLLPLLVCKQVDLSVKYGNTSLSAFAYVNYGLILCGVFDEIETGYQFGRLALKIAERFESKELIPRITAVFSTTISIWQEPLRNSLTPLQSAYQIGLEMGDLYYGTSCAYLYLFHSFFSGKELNELASEIKVYELALSKLKQQNTLNYLKIYGQAAFNLIDVVDNPGCLQGELYDEATMLEQHLQANDRYALCALYVNKLYLCYLSGEYERAIAYSVEAQKYLDGATATLLIPLFNFYDSLAQLAVYPDVSSRQQQQILARVVTNQDKMQQWAAVAPTNFAHKFYLVEAERHRVRGDCVEAMSFYELAITQAAEHYYINEEALANELAAKFYLDWEKAKIAKTYLREAHYLYSRWGAGAKTKALEAQYPGFILEAAVAVSMSERLRTTTETDTGSSSGKLLDLATIMKASQAISSEIVLDKLLATLMKILIENVGAQVGYLILETEGQLFIEAFGSVDETKITTLKSLAIDRYLPTSIINYVARTNKTVLENDAAHRGNFTNDSYIKTHQIKSLLCAPLLDRGQLKGIVYLENNLTVGAFNQDRLKILQLLSGQAAIAITNAKLYRELEENQNRLSQFLEAMPVGVSVHERSGRTYYANQIAKELAKASNASADTTTEELPEIYRVYRAGTERLYQSEQLPIARALAGKAAKSDDLELHLPDKILPLEVSATPIFDETGKVKYAIAAFQDITERKRSEAERISFTKELELKNIALQQAKDKLAQSNRTLEQKVLERTQELSQTLEILKATQAELVFENELLKTAEESAFDYQVGGSLAMDYPAYVVRAADRYLYKALKRGEFCYILNSRQMGKSSLMVRMMHHLQHEGVSCGAIDLTRIGSENVSVESWYKGLAVELWRSFGLLRKVNLKTWWQERKDISAIQRLSQFIEEILLVHVGHQNNATQNIVVFIDEIDSVLGLNFPVSDFFALIRSCYNQRSINREYQRLTFALFGVATPSDLMTDIKTTPFNIGQAIQLEAFKEHEARPLLPGLIEKATNPQKVLKEILAWTGGHPFLTQKLCKYISSASVPIPANREAEWIENLVRTKTINSWESQDEPEHLKTIRDRLFNSSQSVRLLELYRQILHRGEIVAVDSAEEKELLLTGLVVKQNGILRVQNRIYKSIFTQSLLDSQKVS
ncbi:AAA family ATPase [Myxosarcina sp. GI1]|uniref:AAA family ATPase n=1 Tax=Myxosarcina sp. GI1 TaxID=1541065 RepID=UPI000560DD4E|nr:AAA family ATPase [Myxosarcina sp. GI1]